MKENLMNRLLFIDLETTGFSVKRHEIIDIWCALVVEESLDIIDESGGLVSPVHPETASLSALRVNGYTPAGWRTALPWSGVWERVRRFFGMGHPIVGSNPIFDMRFIVIREPDIPLPQLIDTVELARAAGIRHCSLGALCERYDIEESLVAHTARGDVYRCIEVYRHLRGGA